MLAFYLFPKTLYLTRSTDLFPFFGKNWTRELMRTKTFLCGLMMHKECASFILVIDAAPVLVA